MSHVIYYSFNSYFVNLSLLPFSSAHIRFASCPIVRLPNLYLISLSPIKSIHLSFCIVPYQDDLLCRPRFKLINYWLVAERCDKSNFNGTWQNLLLVLKFTNNKHNNPGSSFLRLFKNLNVIYMILVLCQYSTTRALEYSKYD